MKRLLTLLGFLGCIAGSWAQDAVSQNYPVNQANRADGREISTYAIVHEMLKQTTPRCAYKEGMSKTEFKEWQNRLSNAMGITKQKKVADHYGLQPFFYFLTLPATYSPLVILSRGSE